MNKFTEEKLELAIIELLGKEGYPHVYGETIARLIHHARLVLN